MKPRSAAAIFEGDEADTADDVTMSDALSFCFLLPPRLPKRLMAFLGSAEDVKAGGRRHDFYPV